MIWTTACGYEYASCGTRKSAGPREDHGSRLCSHCNARVWPVGGGERGGRPGNRQDRFHSADDRPAAVDRQAGQAAGVKLYMAQHGDTVAGKKSSSSSRMTARVPDNTKRIAQELIVNDKVAFLAGFGVTPAALSVAPLATEAKCRKSSRRPAPRSSPRSRPTSCAPASRWRNRPCRWRTGRRKTASKKS